MRVPVRGFTEEGNPVDMLGDMLVRRVQAAVWEESEVLGVGGGGCRIGAVVVVVVLVVVVAGVGRSVALT